MSRGGRGQAALRAVLDAPDTAARNAAIVAHLDRMQEHLARTQETVASLQSLLALDSAPTPAVVDRLLPPVRALAIRERVEFDAAAEWCEAMFAELSGALADQGADRAGPDTALYDDDFFEGGIGTVVALVPVADVSAPASGSTEVLDLAAARVAVLLHEGPFSDLDRTYGSLGTVVAARGVGSGGPIREHYLNERTTEVCWPIRPA